MDPLEDRWAKLPPAAFTMARASLERAHPITGPKEWAEWAGVSYATAKRVLRLMVDQGIVERLGHGRYRCTVRAHVLTAEWDAIVALIDKTRDAEHIRLLDLVDVVPNRHTQRGDAIRIAATAHLPKPQPAIHPGPPPPPVVCQFCTTNPMWCFH